MEKNIPQHVAIVMDGNGRWAARHGLARIEGHKAGVEAVKAIIRCCCQSKIPCLSLFAFSSENWSRPAEEVLFLMELFLTSLNQELAHLNEQGIRLRFTGERSKFSTALQQQMQDAEALTANNQLLTLNLVMSYGGKWDVLHATKKIGEALLNNEMTLAEINEATFENYLDTQGLKDPDLFIRTSGELRISNFFLWQLAYTELYFTEVCWPDFDEKEFQLALDSFQERQRRFGKL